MFTKSCLNAISVWALKVLPTLFPFFVFTRLIVSLSEFKSNPLDKFFSKTYHVPTGSLFIFFLSVLSGYPMGAKLISTMHETGSISREDAIKMFSFCSVSGPMFMIGTVGVAIFNNYLAGLIIFIVNISASLINGFIFRGKKNDKPFYISKDLKKSSLTNSVFDSLVSILMVGAYIVISFLIIDLIKNLIIFQSTLKTICTLIPINNLYDCINAMIACSLEITRGAIDVYALPLPLSIKTIITCCSIGFGGISILLQSNSFFSKINIPIKIIIRQKLCQALICLILSIPLCILFL